MGSKTIRQISRNLSGTTDIDLVTGFMEGEDVTSSYQVNIGLLKDKFTYDVITGMTALSTAISTSLSAEMVTRYSTDVSLSNAIGSTGAVVYKGTWNASTNTPYLYPLSGTTGNYYIVNVSGNTNLSGITDWQIGDWAIYDIGWDKVDNTEPSLVASNIAYTNVNMPLVSNVQQALDSGITYESTLTPSLTVPNTIGGIVSGTTVGSLLGNTFTEMFDRLLFPTIYPTYTGVPPVNGFTKSPTTAYFEIGASVPLTFTNTYVTANAGNTAGRILLNGIYQNSRGGVATGYNSGGPDLSVVGGGAVNSITHTITQGTQTWTGSTTYAIGPQPLDSTSTPYGTQYPAGTTAPVSTSLEGVYPLFGTTSVISNPDTVQPLVSMLYGNLIVFSMASQPGASPSQSFDVPDVWLSARSLSDVQGQDLSLNWVSLGLGKWTPTTPVSHTIQGNPISYTRYTWNQGSIGDRLIRLVF